MTNDDRILVGETQPFGNQDMGWSFGPQNDTVLTIAWEIWNLQEAKIEMTKNSNESLKPSQLQTESHLHQFCIMSHSLSQILCCLFWCPEKSKKWMREKFVGKSRAEKVRSWFWRGTKKNVWDFYLRNKCRGLFKRESNLIVLNLPPHPTFRFSVMEFQQWRRLFLLNRALFLRTDESAAFLLNVNK